MNIKRSTALIWAQLMAEAARNTGGKTWYALAKMGKELHKINAETEELRVELVQKYQKKDKVEAKGVEEIQALFTTDVEFAPHNLQYSDLQDFPNKNVECDVYGKKYTFNLKDFQAELFELGIIEG